MTFKKLNTRRLIIAAVHAIILTWLCYLAGNIPYSFGSEKQTIKWLNAITEWIFNKTFTVPDDVLPLNVFYDKQFTEVEDEYGIPLGMIDITDRSKLHKVLHLIDSIGNYRYVVCDILFSSKYKTPADSALFALISRMPNLVIAGGNDVTILPESIRSKAYLSSYSTTIEDSDFVKYPLITKGKESLPLHMWKELYGTTLKGNSLFCHSEGKMCRRSIFLDFPVRISELYSENTGRAWLNLGADILNIEQMLDLESMFKDKIILIGSYTEDDIHSTIVGEMPGIMINYNAFHALVNGKHYINYMAHLILFTIFFLITLLVLDKSTIIDFLPTRFQPKSSVIQILLSWVSLSTIFTVIFFILYLLFKEVYDIFFIATYFTLLRTIINLKS